MSKKPEFTEHLCLLNKQPFYHRAVILFTATREIPSGELQKMLQLMASGRADILTHTVEVEECDGVEAVEAVAAKDAEIVRLTERVARLERLIDGATPNATNEQTTGRLGTKPASELPEWLTTMVWPRY